MDICCWAGSNSVVLSRYAEKWLQVNIGQQCWDLTIQMGCHIIIVFSLPPIFPFYYYYYCCYYYHYYYHPYQPLFCSGTWTTTGSQNRTCKEEKQGETEKNFKDSPCCIQTHIEKPHSLASPNSPCPSNCLLQRQAEHFKAVFLPAALITKIICLEKYLSFLNIGGPEKWLPCFYQQNQSRLSCSLHALMSQPA